MKNKRSLFFVTLIGSVLFFAVIASVHSSIILRSKNKKSINIKEPTRYNKAPVVRNSTLRDKRKLITNSLLGSCGKLIFQHDTTICKNSTVLLSTDKNALADTMPVGFWKLLIPGSKINPLYFNIKAFGFDRDSQFVYSIIHQKIIRFDLKKDTVTEIPATNWPGDYTEFTFDFTNRRLLLWRAGRDKVYAVPANGGSWALIGNGSFDNQAYQSSSFWNPLTQRPSFYGGYGSLIMKNWEFENNGGGWLKMVDTTSLCMPPRGGNLVASNAKGDKLYLFSGQGSCSGNEADGVCTLGSGWGTPNGMFCWLKDLWEFDLNNYSFNNILPINDPSVQYEGAVTYDYDKNRFFLFGGFQPDPDYIMNQFATNTNKTFRFRRGVDNGFVEFSGTGDVPPAVTTNTSNGYAYYDAKGKRMIWARYDGIWAFYPDSSNTPSTRKVLWSTGDTAATINVAPTQTTRYWVTISNYGNSCTDSITVTVDTLSTKLQPKTYVCGNPSVTLDAGGAYNSYLWSTGATSSSITVTTNGTYGVTVKDNICSRTDTTNVLFLPVINNFSVMALRDTVCAGDRDSLYVVTPQPNVNYAWYQKNNSSLIGYNTQFVINSVLSPLQYNITAQNIPNVCPTKTVSASVAVYMPLPEPVVKASSITATSVLFSWDAIPGAFGYLVSTDNGQTYHAPSAGATALTELITGLQPNQKFSLIVKAFGNYECQSSNPSAITTVTTLNPIGNLIYVPNSFTPNGDGVNDIFRVYSNALSSIQLRIYNQYGEAIYYTTDNNKGWDGTHNGVLQPMGVYIYYLEAMMQDGTKQTKKGSVTLIR